MSSEPPVLTIDHLHQYAYCPRRAHLMYVDGRWEGNIYTDEGRSAHRRVDDANDVLQPTEENEEAPKVSRSVILSSESLGLIGKLDLVETASSRAVPVETKRGKPPETPERSYEPERIQLMAQGLLLREHGFQCTEGWLYFAAGRTRVAVPFTEELEARTLLLLHTAREQVNSPELPKPIEESPKCWGCSLNGICLPDETLTLQGQKTTDIRRLYPARNDALPLYIQEQGARVSKSGETLIVNKGKNKLGTWPLKDVSELVLCGNVSITAQALHLLCERQTPISHLSTGGWFYGLTQGHGLRNAYDRAAQFAAAADEGKCLNFAIEVVRAKTKNQRTLLRRNGRGSIKDALQNIRRATESACRAKSCDTLRGIEGAAAATYFGAWPSLIREEALLRGFDFQTRNRRPPQDPLNAMLSYGYAVLTKECTVALSSEGLDPWWGLYHRPRHGRPALALDLMEEFRPLIVDSAVLSAVNNGMVSIRDFQIGNGGCAMKPIARKALLKAYEMRMDQLVTHPLFEYRCSWRAIIRLQARLLARWLRGDVPHYTGMTTR